MHLKIFVVLAVSAALASGQRRYYSLEDMPETNFDCRDKILGGYYADPETNCQMFHVCVKTPGHGVQDFRFLCPNETTFDQENQVCADSGDIDCETSGFYQQDFDLYRLGSDQAKLPVRKIGDKKIAAIPIGPSTKSPILTNNIYEDEDFYLQRSETGDRRLQSKDLLRGSSSSNFFNNRNKGKDLDDEEEDEEPAPKRQETGNGGTRSSSSQFRARPTFSIRPKTQYQSQFRKTESPATTTTTTITQQSVTENQNQFVGDRKRTKIAVRKLARKRPDEETETKSSQQSQQSGFSSSLPTQVTQKFGFGDSNSRYSTLNRSGTTPSSFGTSEGFKQQQQQQQQQSRQPVSANVQQQQQQQQRTQQQPRFQNFQKAEQTTPAFFEPTTTLGGFSEGSRADGNKESTPFGLLRNPIVAASPNFNANQNRGSTNGFQQSRQTTANYPLAQSGNVQNQEQRSRQSAQTIASSFPQQQQSRQPLATSTGFTQQNRQPAPTSSSFPQPTEQQPNRQPPATASNFQQQQTIRQAVPTASSFPQQQQNRQPPATASNFQQQQQQTLRQTVPTASTFPQQQQNRQPQGTESNFQQQQTIKQPVPTASTFLQQQQQNQNNRPSAGATNFSQKPASGGDFQKNPQQSIGGNFQFQQSRQQQQQGFAAGNGRGQTGEATSSGQQRNRQSFSRNPEEFDDGDNQEFLKTAPSNNFRPSDLNSFARNNNYKPSEGKNNENARFPDSSTVTAAATTTTKYITPTIVTTPRTTPAYDTPPARQSHSPSTRGSAQSTASSPALRTRPPVATATTTTTAAPPPASSSKLPQRIYPAPTVPGKQIDAAYDYAYYDDSGASFADYGSFDTLGESGDFSRTSQRAKSRLI